MRMRRNGGCQVGAAFEAPIDAISTAKTLFLKRCFTHETRLSARVRGLSRAFFSVRQEYDHQTTEHNEQDAEH